MLETHPTYFTFPNLSENTLTKGSPEEYEKCLVGLTAILREACNAAQQSDEKREKIQALSRAIV